MVLQKREEYKLNWFIYEYACELYEQIYKADSLKTYRKKHSEDEVARFCAYLARRLRSAVVDMHTGKTKEIALSDSMIFDYYLDNTANLTNRLLKAAELAWNVKQEGCALCPNRCIDNPFNYTSMLEEEYEYQMECE